MSHIVGTTCLEITIFCVVINAMTEIIRKKLVLMVLEWFAMILYPKTWVTWSMSSIYRFVKVDPCFSFEPNGFLECKTSNYKIGWAVFNMLLAININTYL
jgi:hypothetical protein